MFRGKSARSSRAGESVQGRGGARPFFAFTFYLLPFAFLLMVGCRQKMADQPRYDPLEGSEFFADGMSARPRVDGTVARGELVTDPFLQTGKINGAEADGFPFAVTQAVLDRGQERFDIYCSQCHGRVGDGNGMIPARGFRRPPSFHTQTLRTATTGHFFDVITNGFGSMPPYGTMVPPRDRWMIIAYIRALQLSQNATINDVPTGDRAKVDQPPAAGGAAGAHGAAEGGAH